MRAEPTPPSARPAQWRRAARASPPPGSVTAGGSRNLATPPPRLRRRRRVAAEQPQNGGLGAGGGENRACQTPPFPPALPTPTAPAHCTHPGTAPTTPRAKVSAHYSRGSDSETKRQGGAHDPSVKTTLPRTALPPSGPLTQYPKGDVPQRPPRINCAHWTPSSAQRAALTTRDLSGHEEASIREAFPSK